MSLGKAGMSEDGMESAPFGEAQQLKQFGEYSFRTVILDTLGVEEQCEEERNSRSGRP